MKELKATEEVLRTYFAKDLESSSLFLIPIDQSDPESISRSENLITGLSSSLAFRSDVCELSGLLPVNQTSNDFHLNCLVFENIDPVYLKQILLNKLREMSGINHRSIRHNKYGLFIPRTGKVTCYSFAHSGSMYYRYRLAKFKLNTIPSQLSNYLISLLSYCPDEYFYNGSRASGFVLKLKAPIEHTSSHKISWLTEAALKVGKFKSGHENVEKFLLESDPETIACEVPVWYEQPQNSRLRIDGVLTGHIDILRYEKNGRIGIWDYKPRARYEKKAHMQVYLYALMLSQRTGIPLTNFICGYFDSSDAFIFNAEEAIWDAPT